MSWQCFNTLSLEMWSCHHITETLMRRKSLFPSGVLQLLCFASGFFFHVSSYYLFVEANGQTMKITINLRAETKAFFCYLLSNLIF